MTKPIVIPPYQLQEETEPIQGPQLEPVSALVQRYFEWAGVFDDGSSLNFRFLFDVRRQLYVPDPETDFLSSSQEYEEELMMAVEKLQTRKRMRLYRLGQGNGDDFQSWWWTESPGPRRGASDRQGVRFLWDK